MLLDNGRNKWPRRLAVALSVLGAAALVAVFVRSGSAQRSAGGDETAPSELGAVPQPLKSVSNAVLSRFDAIDATDNPCETSTTFVDMPGMF